jgi:hypothetical protein
MKSAVTLAAALVLGATTTLSFGQAVTDVPKHKCDSKLQLPSAKMMEEPAVARRFKGEVDGYKKCVTTYLDERKATIKANENAANALIEEYNGTMKSLADQQKAQ